MSSVVEVSDVDLSHWAPGAKLFRSDSGEHFVVCVDLTEAAPGSRAKIIRQPTVVIASDQAAVSSDMVPVFVGEAGESAQSALYRFGYTTV